MIRRLLPTIAGVSVLFLVIAVALTNRAVHAQVSMTVTGLPDKGLILIGPADPRFDKLLKGLLANETTPELDALRPYSVILHNDSRQTVVAYALRWEYTNPNGKRVHVDLSDGQITRLMDGVIRKTPTEYDKVGAGIDPRSWVVATPSTVLKTSSGAGDRAKDANYQDFLQKLVTRFSQGQDVSITLDGAFFEDGSFVGPNRSHLFENFTAEVLAKQAFVQQVVVAAQRGQSMDDVAREIQTSLPDSLAKPTLASDGTMRGDEQYYRYKYASRFLLIYHNSGQESALAWAKTHLIQNPPKLRNLNAEEAKP